MEFFLIEYFFGSFFVVFCGKELYIGDCFYFFEKEMSLFVVDGGILIYV